MKIAVLQLKRYKKFSPSGNRTPVSRVTGGDTYHYTNEDPRSMVAYNLNINVTDDSDC